MEFKTKYKLGDTFWLIHNNKPQAFAVNRINISMYYQYNDTLQNPTKISITYSGSDNGEGKIIICEEEFYPTKEALLKTL